MMLGSFCAKSRKCVSQVFFFDTFHTVCPKYENVKKHFKEWSLMVHLSNKGFFTKIKFFMFKFARYPQN